MFGNLDWYPEGATYLLKHQIPDGSWEARVGDNDFHHSTHDTCFAILFLRRATRTIATGHGTERK